MSAANPTPTLYRFGPFEADLSRGELRKFGQRIRLEHKPWLLLLLLLENSGHVVGRMPLQQALWGKGIFVDFEHGLNVAVKKLRDALSDAAAAPRYIETVAGDGYRFIAPVTTHTLGGPPAIAVTEQAQPELLAPASLVEKDHRIRTLPWVRLVLVAGISCIGLLLIPRWLYQPKHILSARASKTQTDRFVYAIDYSSSAVTGFVVNPSTGLLAPLKSGLFRSGEHPYAASFFRGNDFLYVLNRGRADGVCGTGCNVSGYAVDHVGGTLVELPGSPFPAGSGPVAAAGSPSRKFFYVVNVMSNDVYTYALGPEGVLTRIGPPTPVGTRPFDIAISPSGRFLYVTNQDDANISGFEIDSAGKLHPIAGSPFATGLRPRTFTFHPSGRFAYVVNYGVDPYLSRDTACSGSYGTAHGKGCTISVFAIDAATGSLAEIKGSPFESDGTNPLFSVIDAQGQLLFVTNVTSNNVSVFQISSTTGAIRLVPGSPFQTGDHPTSAALDWSDECLYVVSSRPDTITQFAVEPGGRLHPAGPPIHDGSLGWVRIVAERGPVP